MRASRTLPASRASLPFAVAVVLLFPFLPRAVDAQELARVYEVSAAPGADLEGAIRAHARWREENGDPWTWNVYEVVNGENVGDFMIRSGGHTWADFDAYDDSEFAEAAMANYASTMGPAVGSIAASIGATDTAHVRLPESWEGYRYFTVVTWYLKPDKVQDFQDAIDKIHEAIVQSDWPARYAFASPVNGTGGPQMSLVIFNRSWADMAEPETPFDEMMAEVHGEMAEGVFEKFTGSYQWEESLIMRIRPDLSVNAEG